MAKAVRVDDVAPSGYLSLLPRGTVTLDAREIAELEAWFGADGKFPALRIGNE